MAEETEKEIEEVQEEIPQDDILKKANETVERLEAANKKMEQLLAQQQKVAVDKMFGGESVAGTPPKSKEEKEREYARQFLKGTGFEDELFPR